MEIQFFCLISRANVVLESRKSGIENLYYLQNVIVCFTQRTTGFPKSTFSIADLFAMPYLWVVRNEDICCQNRVDLSVPLHVYVRTHCVPIATWNQNKRTRLLYLGNAKNNNYALRSLSCDRVLVM